MHTDRNAAMRPSYINNYHLKSEVNCAVLCFGVVVMYVCFFVFMPCQGPCYVNLVPLSLGPHFSCMLSYFHDVIIISIHYASLLAKFNLLHSSTNQELFKRRRCYQNSHHDKYRQRREAIMCYRQIDTFHFQQR